MERLLTVAVLASGALIVVILFSLRREHIRVEYSVSWLAAAATVLVLARWDAALVFLGGVLGVSYPPAVLLVMTIGVFLFVLYRISMIVSQLTDNNIALAQRLAILEYQLRAREEAREADQR